jgi:hypothetical protein
MKNRMNNQNSERGGASVKFLLIFVTIILLANAGYNYVPVAYEGEDFKQEMETAVVQGMALPGNTDPSPIIKSRLQKAAFANDIPSNIFIEVKQVNNVPQARAAYSKEVKILPFGLYKYTYQFDHTAVPTGFLAKSKGGG